MDIIKITITKPLPTDGTVGFTYNIEGNAILISDIGAPPWVYARVQKKDWYKPDIIEEVTYERAFPNPVKGAFRISWKTEKVGIYDVSVVATPAPISLPLIGVPPITGETPITKITIGAVAGTSLEIVACRFA